MVKNKITKPIEIRTRENVIIKLNDGKNQTEVAEELCISRRSVGRFKKLYEEKRKLEKKKPDRRSFKGPNAKINENY
jgi:transposase